MTEQSMEKVKEKPPLDSVVSEGSHENDMEGFTVVGKQGRRSGSSDISSSGLAGENGGNQLRNLREIPVNMVTESVGISNQFADLAEDMGSMDLITPGSNMEEDKENQDLQNLVTKAKSVEQEITPPKFSGTSNGGTRNGTHLKKTGINL